MLISSSAQYLSVLHSIRLLNSLIATPIGAALMQQNLTLPFAMVIGSMLLRYPITWCIAETAPAIRLSKVIGTVSGSDFRADLSSEHAQPLLHELQPETPPNHRPVFPILRNFIANPGIVFCFACFLGKRIAFTSESLMFQYASELLHRPLSQTAWIRVPLGLSATLVTGVGLPTILLHLKRKTANSVSVDIWAIRASLGVLVVGFALFWAFEQPVLMSIGKTVR